MKTTAGHALTACDRTDAAPQLHGKQLTAEFRCPICYRSGVFNLNWLGQRIVACDIRFKRIHPPDRSAPGEGT